MPSVNSEIQRILKEKAARVRTGTEAMRAVLEEMRKQVQAELGQAALGSWDAYSLKKMLNAIERRMADFESGSKREISGRLDDMWTQGKALVESPLAVSGMYTGFNLSTSSLNVLKEFAFHKVSGLSGDAWQKVKGELTLGILGGKTPQEVATAIGRNLKEPSIFTSIAARAEAITKTEMGRVFSKASQERMEEAAGYVDGLEKMWRHAGHPRVARPYHLALHGHHVPVKEPFLVGNIAMMFPRDPKAPASEVINCGCDHIPYHPGWGLKIKSAA